MKFCEEKDINCLKPHLPHVLEFVTLQSNKLGYSSVVTARSALSSFIQTGGEKLGVHPVISRFMTGLFNLKPTLPRYKET